MNNMQESPSATSDLENAIRKLEEFSREQTEMLSCSVSPLQKTIALFRSLIHEKKRPKEAFKIDQQEVLQAVETVNRERLFIQKLKSGTPTERKLADSLTKAIEAYNTSRDFHCLNPKSPNKSLGKFFLKKECPASFVDLPKIDLPQQATVEFHYPERPASDGLKHNSLKSESLSSIHLSKQSSELFQMKALALLERYGIASNSEARTLVKSSPILTSPESDASKCTLAQTLTLFPGQTIVVMGSSELNPKTQSINKLFPETFSISLESTQTGFPHPSQRTGWALANQLLPESPQRLDLLGNLSQLFHRKKRVIADLLPQGVLIGKAKKLLKLKKHVFERNKCELIALHKQLALALLQAVPYCSNISVEPVSFFFDELLNHSSSFDLLADANQCIRDRFIAMPHQCLMDAVMNEHPCQKPSAHSNMSIESAKAILINAIDHAKNEVALSRVKAANSPYEMRKLDYVGCLGPILGSAATQIILQYLSEDLLFAPPHLNLFERKIQTMAYQHVTDFLDELDISLSPNKIDAEDQILASLKEKIANDILLVNQNEEADLSLTDAIATYFHKRYTHLTEVE